MESGLKGKCVLFYTLYFANWVSGLRLTEVFVPEYGVKGGSVKLLCNFNLDNEDLLVVKWYKDGDEFFRYIPSLPILTFPLDGVEIDGSGSNMNCVLMRNITLGSSGVYKCEVSADRPSFRTLSHESTMLVIAPPESFPFFAGIPLALNPDEALRGNCTSLRSKPAAAIQIHVRDERVEETEELSWEEDGLESISVKFSFTPQQKHFLEGQLELKCTATLGNGYWVQKMNVSLLEPDPIPRHQLSSRGRSNKELGVQLRRALALGLFGVFLSLSYIYHLHSLRGLGILEIVQTFATQFILSNSGNMEIY